MYQQIATHVFKRAVENDDVYQLPGWAFGIALIDVLIFLPFLLVVGYTFNNVFPVIAMIEDPSPPAYEPVSLNAETDSLAEDMAAPVADESARGGQDTRAISSSFRSLHRTIKGISGWKSYFRGLGCWAALTVSTMFVYGIVSALPFIPAIVAAMISAIALVQLYCAWLHIVISNPSEKRFYQRLPPFRKAFQACALPTVIYFIALEMQSYIPKVLIGLMGMTTYDPSNPTQVPQPSASDSWKGFIVFLVTIALTVFVTIPAHVVLTRTQASLLPEEDETIVPFDRSFQGKLEPAIIGGRGYVTIKDAWQTFSRASWIRLVKLYVKIFAATMAVYFGFALILIPEALLIASGTQKAQ
ncbi:ubiquitin carrier protein [Pestalotiopsis sp. NC0098]|nr:ubiquitin carrier protein [Pestalotiopsis sp. NC0098]